MDSEYPLSLCSKSTTRVLNLLLKEYIGNISVLYKQENRPNILNSLAT